jgi:hypothetical protein
MYLCEGIIEYTQLPLMRLSRNAIVKRNIPEGLKSVAQIRERFRLFIGRIIVTGQAFTISIGEFLNRM